MTLSFFSALPPDLDYHIRSFVPMSNGMRISKAVSEKFYQDEYEKINQLPLDSIFRRGIAKIERERPNWPKDKVAKHCIRAVNQRLHETRFLLNKQQLRSVGLENRKKKIQRLKYPERTRMAEMVSEARARGLISFFDHIANQIDEARAFKNACIHPNSDPRESAHLIREWMNEHRDLLRHGYELDLDDFEGYSDLHPVVIPSEVSIVFPRLNHQKKQEMAMYIAAFKQIEPFRKLLEASPNLGRGEVSPLPHLFRTCSRFKAYQLLKEIVAHPNFSIFPQPGEFRRHLEPNTPAFWFDGLLAINRVLGVRMTRFLIKLACENRVGFESLLRYALKTGEHGFDMLRNSSVDLNVDQLANQLIRSIQDHTIDSRNLSSLFRFPQAKDFTFSHIDSFMEAWVDSFERSRWDAKDLDNGEDARCSIAFALMDAFPEAESLLEDKIATRIKKAQSNHKEETVSKYRSVQHRFSFTRISQEEESFLPLPPAAILARAQRRSSEKV